MKPKPTYNRSHWARMSGKGNFQIYPNLDKFGKFGGQIKREKDIYRRSQWPIPISYHLFDPLVSQWSLPLH
jgi:hypothetical protein